MDGVVLCCPIILPRSVAAPVPIAPVGGLHVDLLAGFDIHPNSSLAATSKRQRVRAVPVNNCQL